MHPLILESKINDLNKILFEVKKVKLKSSDLDGDFNQLHISNYYGLVNCQTKEVLSVVTSGYELFSNSQALALGKKAFVKLFPSVKEDDLIVYNVLSTKKMASCHIDLVHKDVNFEVWKQDTWFPYLRITNSYNRTYKFSLEVGFVRELCSNGVIFDKKTISIKYNHSKGKIPTSVTADVSRLKSLEQEFINYLNDLRIMNFDTSLIFPMVCKAFKLNWKLDQTSKLYQRELKEMQALKSRCETLAKHYLTEGKGTALVIFDVLSDLVSHQKEYEDLPRFHLMAHTYYGRISEWMEDYCDRVIKSDFEVGNYLEEYLKYSKHLQN